MNNARYSKFLVVFTALFIIILGLLSFFEGLLFIVLAGIGDPVDPIAGGFSSVLKSRNMALGAAIFILSGILFLLGIYTSIRWFRGKTRPKILTIILMVVEMPWIILGSLIFHAVGLDEHWLPPIIITLPVITFGSITTIMAIKVGVSNSFTSDSSTTKQSSTNMSGFR